MKTLLLAAVLLLANEARASCQSRASYCFCSLAGPLGLVETKAVDGPKAEVELLEAIGGLDAGTRVTLAREEAETVGLQWLLLGQERRRVSDAGLVSCPFDARITGSEGAPVSLVKSVVGTESCDAELRPFIPDPPCNDVRTCSTSAMTGLVPLLLLAWRRNRRTS